MVNLRIVVEGPTEKRFADQVLAPHLRQFDVLASASPVVTSGRRGNAKAQGGGRTYAVWRDDLASWIKKEGNRPDLWFTTMLDFYGLADFADGFPGFVECKRRGTPYDKVAGLEEAWAKDIGFHRFIPNLQLHEFEALLLVDLTVLKQQFIEHADRIDELVAEIHGTGQSPEEINEGKDTAPSKRIIRYLRQYDRKKPEAGPLAAASIGLLRLRQACPHFGAWLTKLEALGRA